MGRLRRRRSFARPARAVKGRRRAGTVSHGGSPAGARRRGEARASPGEAPAAHGPGAPGRARGRRPGSGRLAGNGHAEAGRLVAASGGAAASRRPDMSAAGARRRRRRAPVAAGPRNGAFARGEHVPRKPALRWTGTWDGGCGTGTRGGGAAVAVISRRASRRGFAPDRGQRPGTAGLRDRRRRPPRAGAGTPPSGSRRSVARYVRGGAGATGRSE